MRCRLPFWKTNASQYTMRGHFISLFLAFALLLGSTHVSALAHSHGGEADHAVQIMDDDHHFIEVSNDGDSESPLKGDMGQHHHCSSLLVVEPAVSCEANLIDRSRVFPASISAMASLSSAPLTQPPSA